MKLKGILMSDIQKTDSLFSAALSLHQAGENERAIDLLDEVLLLDNNFADAYVLKGAILQDEEDYAAAESAFRIALEINPTHPEALQGLGLFLVSQKRYEEAVPYLKKYLEMVPDDEDSLDGILKAYGALPDHMSDIFDVFQHAWEYSHNPEIGLRYSQIITILSDEKDKAYEVHNQIIQTLKTPKTLTDFAYSCWMFDDYDRAIELLQECIEIDPSYVRAWLLLADCYFRKDDLSKALENLEEAILLDPKDYRGWRLKTEVLIKNKDYEKALSSAEKGIDLLVEDKETLKSLSNSKFNPFFQKISILFKLERIDEALEFAGVARELIPENRHFYLYPAQKLADLGRPNESLALLDSTNDPKLEKYFEPYRYLLLHKVNHIDEAKTYIEPKLREFPEKADLLADLATDKYLNDERNLAISITSQLLSLFPGKLRFKTNLGYMYLGESAFDRAEPLLIDVINSENVGKDEEIFAFIARCNLLYLYIIQGHFEKTATLLEILLNSDKAKEEATLRVPFWFQGEIHSDPAQFPGRDITMEMAALGCGIAAALAQDDLERAEQYYSELSSKETDNPLTLVCLGTLEIEKGNKKQAIIAWEKAIEVSNNEEEISILKNWVELLEQK